ncbi:uncharacterized protein [Epargyreus clarus]|uniref:uncharacterized protein n=1 Tax=Epargyreus clarus TaxID=520877 RepID=UPI003C2D71B1
MHLAIIHSGDRGAPGESERAAARHKGRRDGFRATRKNCKHDSDLRAEPRAIHARSSALGAGSRQAREAEAVTLGRRAAIVSGLPPCRATSPWPRLALADDPTAPKWRNVAEAVTPSDRENVGFALERETSAHRSFRNFGWARGDQNNPPRGEREPSLETPRVSWKDRSGSILSSNCQDPLSNSDVKPNVSSCSALKYKLKYLCDMNDARVCSM